MHSGLAENVPYSLSRWTDVPASKWGWFREQLLQRWMFAFDQRTSFPAKWSLVPEETLGLVFWTKNPENLVADAQLLKPYRVKVHMTLTGWAEVEKGAPGLDEGCRLLREVVQAFGPENVRWRFTPVPIVPDVVERFRVIADVAAQVGLDSVFVAFLQQNDRLPETRSKDEQRRLLALMAEGPLLVRLCQDDKTLIQGPSRNLELGICAPPEDFGLSGVKVDSCGCSYSVDPFTVNEACVYGCTYCYAADNETAAKKRNTTRGLPLLGRRDV